MERTLSDERYERLETVQRGRAYDDQGNSCLRYENAQLLDALKRQIADVLVSINRKLNMHQ